MNEWRRNSKERKRARVVQQKHGDTHRIVVFSRRMHVYACVSVNIQIKFYPFSVHLQIAIKFNQFIHSPID